MHQDFDKKTISLQESEQFTNFTTFREVIYEEIVSLMPAAFSKKGINIVYRIDECPKMRSWISFVTF